MFIKNRCENHALLRTNDTKFFQISKTYSTLFKVNFFLEVIFSTTFPCPLMSEVAKFPIFGFFKIVKQFLFTTNAWWHI